MMNIAEYLDKLASLQQSYFDQKTALAKKKEKLYEEGNMTKWGLTEKMPANPSKEEAFDLMLPKETREILKLRETYAYANGQMHEETIRNLKNNDEYLLSYFEEVVKMQADIGSKNIMIWADLLPRVKSMCSEG